MRLNPFIYPSYFYIYFYIYRYLYTRCWFQICFIFIPIWDYLGKRSNLTNIIVQMGCNHHLVYIYIYISLYAIISIVYILVDFFWGASLFPSRPSTRTHANRRCSWRMGSKWQISGPAIKLAEKRCFFFKE